jgi:anti-sigma-K factor RskA
MISDPAAHEVMREQAAAYVLGASTAEERAAFEAHLATCRECEGEVRALLEVAAVLAQAVPQVEPPAALRARVLSQVSQVGATGLRAGQSESVIPVPPPREGLRSPLWLSGLAVAAALAVAVAFGIYALQLRGRVDTLEARLQDALARAQASESQMAATRRVMGEAQSQLAVLTAPDAVRVDLAGQAAAPSASARAFWSRSRGLVLAASNLPALPPGRTYQLWFVGANGPSSAGIFEPDTTGAANLLLTIDPNVPAPNVLAVTLEPAGGRPAPTGAMYLVGSVRSL